MRLGRGEREVGVNRVARGKGLGGRGVDVWSGSGLVTGSVERWLGGRDRMKMG